MRKTKELLVTLKKGFIILTIAALFVGCMTPQSVNAATKKRHEYWWASTEGMMQAVGPNVKANKINVKIKGDKIIVKGTPILTSKLESVQDNDAKLLKSKKRTYKITKKTKFYSLHWEYKTKIKKKDAIKALKKKSYQGFQVVFEGKNVKKVFMLNHSY